jgi:hypothetical protein
MADDPPKVIEINASDVIGVNYVIEPGTGKLSLEGSSPVAVLTAEEQRWRLEGLLKKVLGALPGLPYLIEVVVEFGPDGTPRVVLRLRQP